MEPLLATEKTKEHSFFPTIFQVTCKAVKLFQSRHKKITSKIVTNLFGYESHRLWELMSEESQKRRARAKPSREQDEEWQLFLRVHGYLVKY